MSLSRRAVLGLSAAALCLPRRLGAETPTSDHKFVFVYCAGGWDPALVFAPNFAGTIAHDPSDVAASAGGIDFTDNATRPSVRSFFESWGGRSLVLNGIEVPSVAHDVCTRWIMTGDGRAATDDWVSVLAGRASGSLLLPNVHVAGPLFPWRYPSASVRVGAHRQLEELLSGEALAASTSPVVGLGAEAAAAQEVLLRRRVARWAARADLPDAAGLGAAELLASDRATALEAHLSALAGDADDLDDALAIVANCLEQGLSRVGFVSSGLGGNGGWDAHANVQLQGMQFEALFASLGGLAARLDAAPGAGGGTMLDQTTIVVFSEMGRSPNTNAQLGKDHWTWTSALLFGGRIVGGRTVGAWTDGLTGTPIDLASGEVDEAGTSLLPGHLGATLLALGDVDPEEFVDAEAGAPIRGVLG